MDKVQIFWLTINALRILLNIGFAAMKPDDLFSDHTNAQRLQSLPVVYVLQLPIIGRLFGWW